MYTISFRVLLNFWNKLLVAVYVKLCAVLENMCENTSAWCTGCIFWVVDWYMEMLFFIILRRGSHGA